MSWLEDTRQEKIDSSAHESKQAQQFLTTQMLVVHARCFAS
jgi:hypothetical protein